MPDKKVLIIAYYWPPSGGSGVQRWLKFVKYLPQSGWKPYVFTPENPSVVIKDESLMKDVPAEAVVVKLPIWEPYEMVGRLSKIFSRNKKGAVQTDFVSTKHTSLFFRLSVWLRGNMLVPDPRKFWVRPAVHFLENYLRQNHIQTIITTGPPHSMHLIGLNLKKKNPSLRWIVDMRDPWSEWGLLDSLGAGEGAKARHRKLEHNVLTTADDVITITPFYVRQFERLSERKVKLITNGFDEEDFKEFKLIKSDKFRIRHIGVVNEKCDPRPFMNAVKELSTENRELSAYLEVEFVGQVNPVFKEFVASDPVLAAVTRFTDTVPHKKLMDIYASSALLVLILTGYKDAEGYMPGKVFEYLATGLPVLGVGPVNGDAANLLNHSAVGKMITEQHPDEIKLFLQLTFTAWKTSQEVSVSQNENRLSYSRKQLTLALTHILEHPKPR